MVQGRRKKGKKRPGASIKTGMSPGTMAFIGEEKVARTRIDLIHYSPTSFTANEDVTVATCRDQARAPGVTWINVSGIHDLGLIESLGKAFDFHPLTLEDVVNTTQRLKVEEFAGYLFIVMKMLTWRDEISSSVDIENVSLILGKNYVISFLEREGEVFATVRNRLRLAKGRIRSMQADYLAHALMDAVVDHYYIVVERFGDRIDEIDDQILAEPGPENIKEIHLLKRNVISVRKALWPLREVIGALEKGESALLRPESRVYWRDLYDHIIQIIDMVDTFRDILVGMHDSYLSAMSIRMNEVMQVLTTIATIFIPLTFIVGIYGMNFADMPELQWPLGYPLIWVVMLLIGGGLFAFFRRKKWI